MIKSISNKVAPIVVTLIMTSAMWLGISLVTPTADTSEGAWHSVTDPSKDSEDACSITYELLAAIRTWRVRVPDGWLVYTAHLGRVDVLYIHDPTHSWVMCRKAKEETK